MFILVLNNRESDPMENEEKLIPHAELKLLTETQEQRITDLENLVKRVQADFENFRKQNDRERAEMKIIIGAGFAKKLLDVIDEFEHAINEGKKHGENEVMKGIEMAYENMLKVLNAEGLSVMETENEVFDPHKHEAIRSEENEINEGMIIQVLRNGYYFHNHVIRPAMVVVSKGMKK